MLIDLTLLVLDLGDPLRFHHMLRVFKPSSPMSLGTWSLTVYSLPLTLIVAIEAAQALSLLPRDSDRAGADTSNGLDGRIGARFRIARLQRGALQHELATGLERRPLAGWFHGQFRTRIGLCLLLAVSVLTAHSQAAASLRIVLILLLPLSIIPAGLLFAELRKTLFRLYSDRQVYRATVLVFVGGTVIPLILLVLVDRGPGILGAVSLIVLTSLAVRSLIIKIPHASHENRAA